MADMTSGNTVPDRYVVVIGGMNMDICGRPTSTVVDRDSNPGVVSMSAGGVGQNIAQNMAHLGMPTYLITVYGDDENGKTLERSCAANNINLDYAAQLEGRRSSTYMFITDDTGDLLVAVNDMEICKEINPAFLESRLDFINGAAICLLDANLEPETMAWIGEHVTAPLFGDTVSTVKAHRFDTILNKMTVLKPNDLEASVLTGIGIADQYSAGAAAKTLLDRGVKNVFISLGANGILCARHENDEYSFKHVPPYRTEIATTQDRIIFIFYPFSCGLLFLCCFLWGGSATTNSDDDGKANQCLNYIFLHVHFLFFTFAFPPPYRQGKTKVWILH